MTEGAGRSCPIHYRYRPEALMAEPETWSEQVLYVVGGLYGNPYALDEIEAMAAAERRAGRSVRLLFNGDFNWFDADPRWFARINERVLGHDAMLGNVEYELAHPSDGAGCGCAYPEFVDTAVVERSNRIMARLQTVAAAQPEITARLGSLSRWRAAIFGGLKVLVLHGDPESLAGWGLSHEQLSQEGGLDRLRDWFARCDADVILSTHTCLPVAWTGLVAGRPRLFLNNGAAGMGNLQGDSRGLVVRLGPQPAPADAILARSLGNLVGSLQPVAFDLPSWQTLFDRHWPAGSEAERSYRHRILSGTHLEPSAIGLETLP